MFTHTRTYICANLRADKEKGVHSVQIIEKRSPARLICKEADEGLTFL